MIKNEINIKDILQDKWEIFFSNFDGTLTKTTQFMLASLDLTFSSVIIRCFMNAFLDDVNHEHEYVRPIFLQFVVEDLKTWPRTHQDLIKNPNYINDYNLGIDEKGKDLVMYVFSVPEKYSMEYHHFKQGRYSKFGAAYKNKFSQYVTIKNKKEESIVWQVINKTDGLKRKIEDEFELEPMSLEGVDEVWDMPRKEREIYNYIKT